MASARACINGSCARPRRAFWTGFFDALVADQKNPYLMLDATIIRAHQLAATGPRKVAKIRLWGVAEMD